MRERPILFSGPMVRAILDGIKTQTRRAVKGLDPENLTETMSASQWQRVNREKPISFGTVYFCPYGQVGDRLWVRETWRGWVNIAPPGRHESAVAHYVPDQEFCMGIDYAASLGKDSDSEPWRPSIHMPRWASRILLEITAVRVERLHDISEQDARQEGISTVPFRPCDGWPICDGYMAGPDDGKTSLQTTAVKAFQMLWETINGTDNWEANPWVWVIEFKRIPAPTTDATTHPA